MSNESSHHWQLTPGDQLTAAELHQALELRCAVFVAEQQSPYLDVDGHDLSPSVLHLRGVQGEDLLAYARILGPGVIDDDVHLGRVVIAPIARGRGLGDALVAEALHHARLHWPDTPTTLEAQSHLVTLYARYGFVAVGDPFDDGGIEHQRMHLPRTVTSTRRTVT
ncbi:GNAT family N-acetyltransferase [Nocardioides sp. Bht2]|uniref:GNAT family N-acetyltransferase n=1 Tax=Nocardioides sp. Bht2 TaxID=3392297 RepID=UPI0039B665F1